MGSSSEPDGGDMAMLLGTQIVFDSPSAKGSPGAEDMVKKIHAHRSGAKAKVKG